MVGTPHFYKNVKVLVVLAKNMAGGGVRGSVLMGLVSRCGGGSGKRTVSQDVVELISCVRTPPVPFSIR